MIHSAVDGVVVSLHGSNELNVFAVLTDLIGLQDAHKSVKAGLLIVRVEADGVRVRVESKVVGRHGAD